MEIEFQVHCGYCLSEHTARLDDLTIGQPYGPIYNVHCVFEGIRWGVHASTNSRVI